MWIKKIIKKIIYKQYADSDVYILEKSGSAVLILIYHAMLLKSKTIRIGNNVNEIAPNSIECKPIIDTYEQFLRSFNHEY